MEYRTFGQTGCKVSRLGLGLAQIGAFDLEAVGTVRRLLGTALDLGVNFFDTAASYRNSEALIGRAISDRRKEIFLATKCGHWAAAVPWTAETVKAHVDRSLNRLRTDYLDLVQIHSCNKEVMESGEVLQALAECRKAGKTRFIGYSGDNDAAEYAVDLEVFTSLQTTFNLVDQGARKGLFGRARESGLGTIAKRPIANGVWGGSIENSHTTAQFDKMMDRANSMSEMGEIPGAPEDRILLAMGFTFAHDEVDVAILGTTNPSHLKENVRLFEECLPIQQNVVDELHHRFDKIGVDWGQLT
ncbi:MAG TPA: aldo/keto reductase [Candidatus Latescibacteria bacterium]|nr:aldo/keto reductase [Candidatus Latescibacterota bacterium]|tara:strand:+ start:473 stop:1375 length:903 start_codon:yes stop_codon:yes gene_type:complete